MMIDPSFVPSLLAENVEEREVPSSFVEELEPAFDEPVTPPPGKTYLNPNSGVLIHGVVGVDFTERDVMGWIQVNG